MTITIPDDWLRDTGLTEKDVLVEIACRLFDADGIHLPAAARLAGLSRVEFETALIARGIAPHRPTVEDVRQDVETMRTLERDRTRKAAS